MQNRDAGGAQEAMPPSWPPARMLCQSCLRVRPFTDAGHCNEEPCECGGDFCGCESCQVTIGALEAGRWSALEAGTRYDVLAWTAQGGATDLGLAPRLVVTLSVVGGDG